MLGVTSQQRCGDIYVANAGVNNGNMVSVINPAGTVVVGNNPSGVAVSPTGSQAGYIYVANGGSDTL